ncbi:MAG: polysaccharide deacetylase family protein [bacterium]|nr:polysaccharide deacetylase family protein [bacterium]
MKKKVIFIVISLLVVGLCVSITIFYQEEKRIQLDENIVSNIKKSYSPFVKTTRNKKVYQRENDQMIEIGTVSQDVILPLEKKEVKDSNDIYYHIANSNYFIDYYYLEPVIDYQLDQSLDHYLVTKKIKTNPTTLYQNGSIALKLDVGLEFDCFMVNDNQYYVKYLDGIYYIQDSYMIEDIKLETPKLDRLSVLSFSDNISNEKVEEVLKYLRDNHYESISIADFKFWISANVDLLDHKVLLISYQTWDSEKQAIMDKYNYQVNYDLETLSFQTGDQQLKVGDTTYYKYEIYSTTSLDRIKQMLVGIKEVKITSISPEVAVLNYHFFYDSNTEACNESICLSTDNFRKQLTYLKENNYKVLTMQEFNDWMDRKITLPTKSVLITIDDGAMGTSSINGNKLIPLLEEFQIPATLFLITGWWEKSNYQSPYLEIHSHGDELHHDNYCKNGICDYKGLLLSKEELKSDLQTSIDKIGTNLSFCYPFYRKNNTMVEALKEIGFSLAFVGGNRKAKQSDSKYAIPRYVIYKNTSLNSFIQMVS